MTSVRLVLVHVVAENTDDDAPRPTSHLEADVRRFGWGTDLRPEGALSASQPYERLRMVADCNLPGQLK